MPQKLFDIFEQIGLPYFRQGSLSSVDDYQDSFFTFWNIDTPTVSFYDDARNGKIWIFAVYFYTNNPSLIYSKMDEFIELAKQNGFVVVGNSNDAPTDRADFFGRYVQIKYIEI